MASVVPISNCGSEYRAKTSAALQKHRGKLFAKMLRG